MKNKLNFIKDAIHGEITLFQPWVIEILKTKEFIRLTRIKQLGLAHKFFPNAFQTRYIHSLGTYYLINEIIKQLNCFKQKEINELIAAALLHDLGHGPHSHAFELYMGINHEKYSQKFILDKTSKINQILRDYEIDPNNVVKILTHKHKNKILNELISAQIDVDRMDYLVRDSYFTGVCYGNIDASMLIKWLVIKENKICFQAKAISSLENFLLARYHMYQQIYNQPKILALQQLVNKILQRFYWYYWHQKEKIVDKFHLVNYFLPWLNKKNFTTEQYLLLDDSKLEMFLEQMQYENDLFLQEGYRIYSSFFHLDYQVVLATKENLRKFQNNLKQTTKFPSLYLHQFTINQQTIYQKNKQPVWIYDELTGKISNLYQVSTVLKNLNNNLKTTKFLVIYNHK